MLINRFILSRTSLQCSKIHFWFNETKVFVLYQLKWHYKLQHLFFDALYNKWKRNKRTVLLVFFIPFQSCPLQALIRTMKSMPFIFQNVCFSECFFFATDTNLMECHRQKNHDQSKRARLELNDDSSGTASGVLQVSML